MQMKQSGGISTVYGVADVVDIVDAARRLEYRWSLLNVRTAVGGTAAAAVEILMRRIGELCYHFKQGFALCTGWEHRIEARRDTAVATGGKLEERRRAPTEETPA